MSVLPLSIAIQQKRFHRVKRLIGKRKLWARQNLPEPLHLNWSKRQH